MPPSYPPSRIKELLKKGFVEFWSDVLQEARTDFGSNFSEDDIIKCLLLLNDRPYWRNPEKNHFHKTDKHRSDDNAMMDYYKMQNIHGGINVYTHFYIDEEFDQIVICSFKEL